MLESEYHFRTVFEMLPKYIYEALPALYFVLGLICALTLQSSIAMVSSALLIAAAVLVHIMRKSYRNQNIKEKLT